MVSFSFFQANIICPFYRGDISSTNSTERYVVYNVSRQEFESCRLNSHDNVESGTSTPKIVALCDRPFQPQYFTLTFRPFSPTPGAFEFQPGNDYYFMSTSSQKNIYQKNGGRCRTHNMRLVFRIRDVDLKDDFRSVEHRTTFDVAQPRSDNSDEDDVDYDDDDDEGEDVENENVDFRRTEKEKAYPVLSNASRSHVINVFQIVFVTFLISHRYNLSKH